MKKLLIITLTAIVLLSTGCETHMPHAENAECCVEISDGISDALFLSYTGDPVTDLNGNIPYFTESEIASVKSDKFAPLDKWERPGVATAVVGTDTMPEKKRGDINTITPAGWKQAKYGWIDNGGWLYNRCHLIAWSLSGNDSRENLMTGTRYFNTKGMLPYEIRVLEYLDTHPKNHVLYRATPIYKDEDLVARSLVLEAYSLEDSGALSFCVCIHNVQPGIDIDYRTGESRPEGGNEP